jgi:hypothetical protein
MTSDDALLPRRSCACSSETSVRGLFFGEAGLFADFAQTRRTAPFRKKLKHRSPHAVLCWGERLIPFFDEAEPRASAPEDRLTRSRPCQHRPVRAVNARSYLSRHVGQHVGVSPA